MRTSFRFWGPPLLAAGILVFALTGTFHAQDSGDKTLDQKIHGSLRTVINRGADLYNQNRDYSGCFRVYHGALLTVRPLLDHHPDLQKAIDAGVARADMTPINWQKAFALREVIDRIRDKLSGRPPTTDDKKGLDKKGDDLPKIDDKKPVDFPKKPDENGKKDTTKDKKADNGKKDVSKDKKDTTKKIDDDLPAKKADKKSLDKKADDGKSDDLPAKKGADGKKVDDGKGKADGAVKADDGPRVTGKVTYKGKPVDSGYVTFVGHDQKRYSASLREGGTYSFRKVSVPPGQYTIIVEEEPGAGKEARIAIPQQYRDPDASTLRVEVRKGANNLNFNLQ